ncbi:hypothetical protein Syun_019189 [Stephania yunnanensis]|uniref:Nucleolar GTP-binding protein 1 n=1 Tax=Stephania yunnanensis TaxID=152371 RepID=A0AAP0ITM5_9MAGN
MPLKLVQLPRLSRHSNSRISRRAQHLFMPKQQGVKAQSPSPQPRRASSATATGKASNLGTPKHLLIAWWRTLTFNQHSIGDALITFITPLVMNKTRRWEKEKFNDGRSRVGEEERTSSTYKEMGKEDAPGSIETVGAFQKLPMVMPSIDIISSAMRKAKRELVVPLRDYIENFPNKKHLHPYERDLIKLTLGDGNYEEVLGRVNSLKKKVVSVAKERASLCAKGLKNVEEIFKLEGNAVDDLLNIAKTLRAMPVVDLERPTLCLVGAPNVGKSSLCRILSTGKPEVTDTPGLLRRHDEDRNNLEKLTLAVLTHLPTAILYVHDLSGECGTSPSDQFVIYKEIRERFSDHLWIDVVSKCDLLRQSPVIFSTDDVDLDYLDMRNYMTAGPDGAICVSVKNEIGLDQLKDRVHDLLVSQLEKIKNQENN